MLRRLTALALVTAALFAVTQAAQAHRLSGHPRTVREQLSLVRAQLRHDRSEGVNHWLGRDRAYIQHLSHPPHERQWWCIHHYEGAWNDTGSPFWGGLQMDWSFQKTYGGMQWKLYGTADHWTPLEQMWVAERAFYAGRGFYPWPNTARYCGLI